MVAVMIRVMFNKSGVEVGSGRIEDAEMGIWSHKAGHN